MKAENSRRVLIIRSSGFQHIDKVIVMVRQKFKSAEISILTHVHGKELAAKYGDVNVLVYPYKGNFSVMRPFKTVNYDAVVVPTGNVTGSGFLNVFMFALTIKAKERYICNIKTDFKSLTTWSVFRTAIKGGVISTASMFLAIPAAIVVFIIWHILGIRVIKKDKGKRKYG
ncbi:MAG: hypothetical protein HQK88_08200 [Nitrospirae bacterium]|nr:hypothetical protein [Nitrospirota bacterium]MBF0520367.1 hypothetical protein [Nitrospirota bacterium]MBF0534867.1 hypothetical protein [Nitrospirota bacterium]MBF0616782.1 hypothetical protein [Nitrospirota bacterium]